MGRGWSEGQTHCARGHELRANIYVAPNGDRCCRVCRDEAIRRWQQENADGMRAAARERRAENPEQVRRRDRRYYAANQDAIRVRESKRRAREDPSVRRARFVRWQGLRLARATVMLGMCCAYCGSFDELELDHIEPLRRGERDDGEHQSAAWTRASKGDVSNLQLLCKGCHWGKTLYERLAYASPQTRMAWDRAERAAA